MSVYHLVMNSKKQSEEKLQHLKKILSKYPETSLLCRKNGKYYKWFEAKGSYIPKNRIDYVKQLAMKKYYSCKCMDLEREIHACEAYINICGDEKSYAEDILNHKGYGALLEGQLYNHDEKIQEWLEQDEIKNTFHAEELIVPATQGKMVRSKSEAIIDQLLYTYHIPFKYEAPIEIEGSIFFPDFTIVHPKTGKVYYWEHFGIMDNVLYARKQYDKLRVYSSANILPSVNLIVTFESKEKPFSFEDARRIIEDIFLS